jgi:hypothetical protein
MECGKTSLVESDLANRKDGETNKDEVIFRPPF